jgi:hypothetical protein
MSTIKVNSIQNTSGVEVYTAKAWVNFNGTGTIAIRAAGNVSSITDNGVGDYTVNFTTSMPDANYAVVAIKNDAVSYENGHISVTTLNTAGGARIQSVEGAAPVATDSTQIHVAIFR